MSGRPAGARVAWRRVDGILLLDKPVGLSSNTALQRARRLYRAHKAGHTGSLDPLASGVLPLCFGEATKVAGYLLDADKSYLATLVLGARTTTGDREGAVAERCATPELTAEAVDEVLGRFLGRQSQVPPMYSALKRDGQALYALARRGVEVAREAREIWIRSLRLEHLGPGTIEFSVTCSKGTYIRTLGEDIARALGSCGHLGALRRTGVGAFAGRPIHRFEDLERLAGDEPALDRLLLPLDAALQHLPGVTLDADRARRLCHGQAIGDLAVPGGPLGPASADRVIRIYGPGGAFLGLATQVAMTGLVQPARLIADVDPLAGV